MNRIEQKFNELKKQKRTAFVAYITAGDPNLKITEELVLSFENSGVDIIELGIPFSDPLADGPTIQQASERALKNGVGLDEIFKLVKKLRVKTEIPIALMGYYNPVYHYGEKKFIDQMAKAGADGWIIPDLPPDEAKDLIRFSRQKNISTVFFLAPTTLPERAKKIVQASTGFIYYVSVAGVTGSKKSSQASVKKQIQKFKKLTDKPICVGFGVSSPDEVKAFSKSADGVIVGSAIIKEIVKHSNKKDLVKNVSKFVSKLTKPLSV